MKVLQYRDKGEEVKKLQELLGMHNCDGIFGQITLDEVKNFQRKNGLTVDGIVGKQTWEVLTKGKTTKAVDECVIYKPLSVHITKSPNRPIKYLAIHYTGSSNSKQGRATSTYNTFVSRSASADFCVDDKDIVQFNPDLNNYYCWAVGDKKQNSNGGSLYGKATNKNTISIEVCSTCKPSTSEAVNKSNHSGWSFTDEVLDNAVKLAKILMKKYNIPIENVVRHYDISGKLCPAILGWNDDTIYDLSIGKYTNKKSNSDKWIEFKNRLK